MASPKFVVLEPKPEPDAEEGCDSIFAFHTETPRCLMEFVSGGEGEFMLIDPTENDSQLATLPDQARFFVKTGGIAGLFQVYSSFRE